MICTRKHGPCMGKRNTETKRLRFPDLLLSSAMTPVRSNSPVPSTSTRWFKCLMTLAIGSCVARVVMILIMARNESRCIILFGTY
jgi:hypothetical protein